MRWLLAVVPLLLAGCAGTGTASDDDSDASPSSTMKMVSMVDDSIKNGNFAIRTMDQAMYMNEGQRAHTVTVHKVGDAETSFKVDRTLQPDEVYTYTFDARGTYHVYCRFHGTMTTGMTSTVEVS